MMLRTAKLRCRSGEYPCVMHDVSETGAKLRLFHAHPPEAHKFLELANGELYAVERRWMDGGFAGYSFSSQVEVEDFIHEKSPWLRRPMRLRISHPVSIAEAGEPAEAALANLSQQGACIEADRQLPLRAPVHVAIPGGKPRLAHVCWRRNFRHGVVFQKALTLDHLAEIALQLQPYEAGPAEAEVRFEQALMLGN
jgi:hypothetical protein